MASINKVVLVGHMCADPKLSYLPSGSPVAEFSVATNEKFKDREGNAKETVEFHRVKVFGRSAEFCNNYLAKGRLVYIEGTLRTRSWEDQQGQKRYTTEVVVSGPGHTVQALDRGQDRGDAGQESQDRRPARGNQGSPRQGSGGRGRQDDDGPAFPSNSDDFDQVPF